MVYYVTTRSNELSHHGVKGMKWGVRRDRQKRRITTMYDRSNMWTKRKITKLEAKGKDAKAAVMKEMVRRNDAAKKEKLKTLSAVKTKDQYKALRKDDIRDVVWGGQSWMKRNASHLTGPISRLHEYKMQRGMRWSSNFTLNSTLARMSVSDMYAYLDNKTRSRWSFQSGYNSNG